MLIRSRARYLATDDGFTLIELLVAMIASVVVIGALLAILEISLAQSTKIANETYSDQLGRTAMTQIVSELHDACMYYEATPVREVKSSSYEKSGERELTFVNTGDQEPVPPLNQVFEHKIVWEQESGSKAGSLVDYVSSGASGTWPNKITFGTPSKTVIATHISLGEVTVGGKAQNLIFQYYRYGTKEAEEFGTLKEIAMESGKLPEKAASEVAAVGISFKAASTSSPSRLERSIALSNRLTFAFSAPNQETPIKDAPCQ